MPSSSADRHGKSALLAWYSLALHCYFAYRRFVCSALPGARCNLGHWGGIPLKIFVSYRRDDDPNSAARVRDGLAAVFGKPSVFMDVENLLAGQRFDIKLAEALAGCDVLIAVIGERWMDILRERTAAMETDTEERDHVREEISAALQRGIIVIPVRVGRDGKLPALPRPSELPDDIRDLVAHQKHDVRYETHGRDVADLIKSIQAVSPESSKPTAHRLSMHWVYASSTLALVGGVVGLLWIFGVFVSESERAAEQIRLSIQKTVSDASRDEKAVCVNFDSYLGRLFSDPEEFGIRVDTEKRKEFEGLVALAAALEGVGLIKIDRTRRLYDRGYAPYTLTELGKGAAVQQEGKKIVRAFCGGAVKFLDLEKWSEPASNQQLGRVITFAHYRVRAETLPHWLSISNFSQVKFETASRLYITVRGCADNKFGIPTHSRFLDNLEAATEAPLNCGPAMLCKSSDGWGDCR